MAAYSDDVAKQYQKPKLTNNQTFPVQFQAHLNGGI